LTARKASVTLPSVEYVTITKAAKILGVTRPTVYKMIADGKLKVRRFILDTPGIAIAEIERAARANGHKGGRPRKGEGK
jgi:predicted DNA-binding protein (UPF0251 family)